MLANPPSGKVGIKIRAGVLWGMHPSERWGTLLGKADAAVI